MEWRGDRRAADRRTDDGSPAEPQYGRRRRQCEKGVRHRWVIVVGAEGKGLGRLVKEKCDIIVSLPMQGGVSSLNASAAGAVFLYEVVRQRRVQAGV